MIEEMDWDVYFLISEIAMWIYFFSPFWITVILFFVWRKSIYSNFKFFSFSCVMFSCALVITYLGLYVPVKLELEYYRLSGDSCIAFSVCRAAEFIHKNFSIVILSSYLLFIIIIIAMIRARKPRWLGFGLRANAKNENH